MVTQPASGSLVLIVDDIRSAHNVGALFRTASGAGVSKIFLCGFTQVPAAPSKLYPTPAEKELTKTALGAETDIPFEQSEATACIEKLKSEGYTVIGLEQSASAVHYQTPLTTNKVALLIGTEVTGIPEELQKQCDVLYEIPMYGGKNSLNVAVATGVMLYSLRSNLQKTV